MLDSLHCELFYLTSRFLSWNDIYHSVKHINKRLQYEVENNKKIIRRKSLVYMRILQQQLHFRKLFARPDILSSYNPMPLWSKKKRYVNFFKHVLNEIDISSLSENQKNKLNKLIEQFGEYYPDSYENITYIPVDYPFRNKCLI